MRKSGGWTLLCVKSTLNSFIQLMESVNPPGFFVSEQRIPSVGNVQSGLNAYRQVKMRTGVFGQVKIILTTLGN